MDAGQWCNEHPEYLIAFAALAQTWTLLEMIYFIPKRELKKMENGSEKILEDAKQKFNPGTSEYHTYVSERFTPLYKDLMCSYGVEEPNEFQNKNQRVKDLAEKLWPFIDRTQLIKREQSFEEWSRDYLGS